jgi:succinate dehydrogenase/fumarate reductase flavoprotein subunit
MWHYHGCYGFPSPKPGYPYGVRVKRLPDWRPGDGDPALPRMAWILLDHTGRRFMNEYEPYVHDTGARPLGVFDPAAMKYPRNPAFLITDEAGRRMYPLGKPTYNDPEVELTWSPDNSREVAAGILAGGDTPEDLARQLGLPPEVVAASVANWNQICAQGRKDPLGRPSASMHPLLEAPFYGARMVPVVSNTQGGPRRDEHQRVIDPFGEPIDGLFAVGECGSAFGFLYMSGCNLAECFISGEIAGREAARA